VYETLQHGGAARSQCDDAYEKSERQQNLILTNVPTELANGVLEDMDELGLAVDANEIWGTSIACTGEPHCNFSVGETKDRLRVLVAHLERTFGDEIADLRLHLDGCPHACAQHWVGDLGFQGTTLRDAAGERHQAYDVFVRGGLDRPAAIGRPVFRRVPTADLDVAVVGLVEGWIAGRQAGESFRSFCDRHSDDDLGRLAGREPVRGKEAVET